jgi:hypothetical protein
MTLTRQIRTLNDIVPGTPAAGDAFIGGVGGVVGRVPQSDRPSVNVLEPWTGVTGDGVTNDSVALQALIDGGERTLVFPPGTYKCNVTLKQGVFLVSEARGYGYLPSSPTLVKFLAAGAGAVVDTPVTNIRCCGIVGINVYGLGAGTACKGIRFRDVDFGIIRDVFAYSMSDEGVLLESPCTACTLDGIYAVQCVLDRTQATYIGAIDIHGTDHWITRTVGNIAGSIEGTVQSASLFCVGIALRASVSRINGMSGELSDIGVYLSGSRNQISDSRADLNYGHGWYIVGGANQIENCQGLDNSQDTTNAYDNWQATSASSNNQFSNCYAVDLLTKKARYGFNDGVSSAINKNHYVNCKSDTAVTAQFNAAASNGSSFSWPSGGHKTLTVNSATPDVTAFERFITANTGATTITDFLGSVPGQRIVILCNDANTTIQHNGATIVLAGAGNKKLRSGVTYEFWKVGGAWREVAQLPLGVTADVGDAAKTLQARLNEETQIWNTVLTANRAVTLSTTGAYAGATFRIVRTANATGAFTLDVGTGPLKSLAVAEWVDVTYSGSAWVLTGYGGL